MVISRGPFAKASKLMERCVSALICGTDLSLLQPVVGGGEDGECSVLYTKVAKVMELTELAMENKLLSV